MKKTRKRQCADCGVSIIATHGKTVRCRSCQLLRQSKREKNRHATRYGVTARATSRICECGLEPGACVACGGTIALTLYAEGIA